MFFTISLPFFLFSPRAASWPHLLRDVCLQLEQRHHGQRHPGPVLRHGKHRHRALYVSTAAAVQRYRQHVRVCTRNGMTGQAGSYDINSTITETEE